MILRLRRISKEEKEHLDYMAATDGWRIVRQMFDGSIEMSTKELIKWKFQYDEDGNIKKESVRKYEKKQEELGLLKNFLQFMENPAILKEEEEE